MITLPTPQNIEQEVTQQRKAAITKIGAWDLAREFTNQQLDQMPVLLTGTISVQYQDARGNVLTKQQDKNLATWCIILQALIEQGNTSTSAVSALLQQFQPDEDEANTKNTATAYCQELIRLNILAKKAQVREYTADDGTIKKSRVWVLTEEFKEVDLKHIYTELAARSTMICKPMEFKPKPWTNNNTGIGEDANLRLVSNNIHDIDQRVLDAVNKLQAVKFRVSEHLKDEAFNMIANNNNITKEEISIYSAVLDIDHDCHFPLTLDKRGRMYYRGGLLTPQGTDFCKAAFQFANSVPLGADGVEGIAIHTANVLGFDKLSINARIDLLTSWYDCRTFDKITNSKTLLAHFPKASRFQGIVAVLECKKLFNHLDNGESVVDFESTLVCHADGTANGCQHSAAITHDRTTAAAVNCTAALLDDEPADIYGDVARAAEQFATPAATLIIQKYGRDLAKNPVMIHGYGAGKSTIQSGIRSFLIKSTEDATLAAQVTDAIMAGIEHVAGAVSNLTNVIKMNTKAAIKKGQQEFEWVTADGFICRTIYNDVEDSRVRAGAFSALTHTPAVFDEIKTVGAMAPNFTHSIDAAHLRGVVRACDHDLVTVHDSIGCHAGNYWATSRAIRAEFVAVHDYDALKDLCKRMGGRVPQFEGDYHASEAMNAPYIFS